MEGSDHFRYCQKLNEIDTQNKFQVEIGSNTKDYNHLQTARYLSVARLMVRNVVQDIKIFFTGYLNIISSQGHLIFMKYFYLPYIGE